MAKFVEMDEKVTLKGQMEKQVAGPVILINKFNVETSEEKRFLKAWQEDATRFKNQPGFISAQLHKGIGNSTIFVNYAVWQSLNDFKNAVDKVIGTDWQSQLSKYPESLVISPHLFKKVAVPGICDE